MLNGSCLCGEVRYEIEGDLTQAVYCHCSMCRKAHGSAFRARATVRAEDFRWVHGQLFVRYYESSPGNRRGFCVRCGSPLISKDNSRPAQYGIALGSLDGDPGVPPLSHVYVNSKAPWHDIADSLSRYAGPPVSSASTLRLVSAGSDANRAADDVPPGFEPLDPGSPYRELSGPFFKQTSPDKVVLALRIHTKHTNGRGIAHGGLLLTLADMALGYNIHHRAGHNPPTLLTASITSEFVGSAREGDWVEAHAEVLRIGRRMAFANTYLTVGDRKILRASGVFSAAAASAR